MIKVLNLYAGIGGNRKLWPNEQIEVTAIENNPQIAKIYQDFFPNDKVIVADAHQFLLEHFEEFDFIWSSPPCPTHSGTTFFLKAQGCIRYPDMSLWQEIIFLSYLFKGIWVVENVESYYEPFFKPIPYNVDRHYFWCNFKILEKKSINTFNITNMRHTTRQKQENVLKQLEKLHGFNLSKYKIGGKQKMLANCIKPELGLHIFNMAFRDRQKTIGEMVR